MHNIKTMAAQGDLLVRKVAEVPQGFAPVAGVSDHVVAHSETGHHHVAVGVATLHRPTAGDTGMLAYLEVPDQVVLTHRRSFDTHTPILLTRGVWELRRQREYVPEGWQRVED